MHLTENQLRKKIRVILKELLGAKSKKGTQLQRALGGGGAIGYPGEDREGGYGFDDDFDHDYYDDSDYE